MGLASGGKQVTLQMPSGWGSGVGVFFLQGDTLHIKPKKTLFTQKYVSPNSQEYASPVSPLLIKDLVTRKFSLLTVINSSST